MNEIEHFRDRLKAAHPALRALTSQLGAGFAEGRWSALLCDDVSGRGPAYILQSFAHEIASAHHVSVPSLLFFSGGVTQMTPQEEGLYFPGWQSNRPDSETVQRETERQRNELLKLYFSSRLTELGQRVLIITDIVDTGQTVLDAAKQLNSLGVVADIATVGATDVFDYYSAAAKNYGLDLVWYVGKDKAANDEVLSSPKKSNELFGIEKVGIEPTTVATQNRNNALVVDVRQELQEYGIALARAISA